MVMPLFLLNAWGWIWAHKRLVAYIVLGIIVLLLIVFAYRGCRSRKSVQIDLSTVDKINNANRKEREAELTKVIEENADVVRTNDNRTAISETNAIERDRIIAEKVKAADKAIQDAKAGGKDVTAEDLNCLLIPTECK